jgi:hypothetical protein
MFISLSVLYVQQAVAQKESHKDYNGMKIAECNSCHKTEGVAVNHDSDWVRAHRTLAGKRDNNCSQCHDQAYCLDCHQGGGIDTKLSTQNYKHDYTPKSHRSDWLEIHPIKANDNPQSCVRCHDQKYCTACHSKFRGEDLQFQSHRRQFSDIRAGAGGPLHATFGPGQCAGCHRTPTDQLTFPSTQTHWRQNHASEARRNLQACQTCHSDGDVCLSCHSNRSGFSLRVNPHPRNWGSIKGNYKDKGGMKTCLKCHDGSDPLIR